MNKSLTRSIGFWLLLVLSLVSTGIGGWLIAGQVGSMTSTLLDNTATGVDVYVGQSLIVVGSALLGAGIIGILISVALTAVQAMLPAAAPVVVEPIDWTAEEPAPEIATDAPVAEETVADDASADGSAEEVAETTDEDDAQKGSSGSTATATKINVK
ncbi:hypothetical protein [Microbacterium sp. NPDC089695]|uniref:hypothetical protein n=1 Tax=Microbacterium sp. NPDC089695 TaxID=3364198 RepID=UPI00380D9DD6